MRRSEWDELALDKLTRVLGRQQGERILQRTLSALGRPSLASEQDLYTFGQLVVAEEGFAGAVGALLSTIAVMRGAYKASQCSACPAAAPDRVSA